MADLKTKLNNASVEKFLKTVKDESKKRLHHLRDDEKITKSEKNVGSR
jgi:hypothetical protein